MFKIHRTVLIHTGKEGKRGGKTVRRLEGQYFTRGVKNTNMAGLYLQSINSIKHQQRRHLGFGVFIVISSMSYKVYQKPSCPVVELPGSEA
jgi:hypothetical protein